MICRMLKASNRAAIRPYRGRRHHAEGQAQSVEFGVPVQNRRHRLLANAVRSHQNPKEYGQKPIGNGPYELKAYKSGEEIILEKDDSYKGPRKVKNAGIDFKVYQSLDAGLFRSAGRQP